MHQLSVPEFDRAVIGIGTDLEASILTATVLMAGRCGGPATGPYRSKFGVRSWRSRDRGRTSPTRLPKPWCGTTIW
jgi:hypothetical protein